MGIERWDADVRRAMRGRRGFRVRFSASQVAAALWDYGEDDLAERALTMTEDDLVRVQQIAASYEDPSYPLPVGTSRITHNHVNAMAAIAYFEGRLRSPARTRRRPVKDRPQKFTPTPVSPFCSAVWD